MDYTGFLLGKMLLVLIDTHSKWIEVEPAEFATTKTTVEELIKLRKIFSTHGIPENLYQTMVSMHQSRVYRFCKIEWNRPH